VWQLRPMTHDLSKLKTPADLPDRLQALRAQEGAAVTLNQQAASITVDPRPRVPCLWGPPVL